MPKAPRASLPFESVLSGLETTSNELAEKATLLSNTIEEIRNRLVQMPGKVMAGVYRKPVTLEFERRGEWDLWLQDEETPDNEPVLLTKVSVIRKARAFPALMDLLNFIEQQQRASIVEIDKIADLLPRGGAN